MLTKHKLTAWRREALKIKSNNLYLYNNNQEFIAFANQANERILELTQELIDQHLLAESKKGIN